MATDSGVVYDANHLATLIPLPSSCFSPVATITSDTPGDGTTAVELPADHDCNPSYSYWKDPCPSGYETSEQWPIQTGAGLGMIFKTCCPSGYGPATGAIWTYVSTLTTAIRTDTPSVKTTITGTFKTTITGNYCYSNLSVPTVLMSWAPSGQQATDSFTITNPMLVTAFAQVAPYPDSFASLSSSSPSSGDSLLTLASASASASASTPTSTSALAKAPSPAAGSSSSDNPTFAPTSASLTKATDSSVPTHGLSSGAKVGVAVTVPVAVVALILGIGLFFWRRKRSASRSEPRPASLIASASYPELENHPSTKQPYAMLDSDQKFELAAGRGYELDAPFRQPEVDVNGVSKNVRKPYI